MSRRSRKRTAQMRSRGGEVELRRAWKTARSGCSLKANGHGARASEGDCGSSDLSGGSGCHLAGHRRSGGEAGLRAARNAGRRGGEIMSDCRAKRRHSTFSVSSRAGPRRSSAASCAAPRSRRTISICSIRSSAATDLRVRCVRDSVPRAGRDEIQASAAAHPLPAGFPAHRQPVGRPDDADQHGVFLQEHAARRTRDRDVSQSRRAPPNRC